MMRSLPFAIVRAVDPGRPAPPRPATAATRLATLRRRIDVFVHTRHALRRRVSVL